jgi:hypothetical protein
MPFINMTKLGKQVKEAHKAGRLKTGIINEHQVVVAPHCLIGIKEDEQPNKMKAIITEYVGYIPADPIEAGEVEQDRLLDHTEVDVIRNLMEANSKPCGYVITPVIITDRGNIIRIIQDKASCECLGVRQDYLDLITMKTLDYDIEGDPRGPEVVRETGNVYFSNETTLLVFSAYTNWTDKSKEILSMLKLMELREDL